MPNLTISASNLMEKYGKGKKSTMKCRTCNYERDIYSSGVHTSEGGAVMVYATSEEFSCPNCSLDGDIMEDDEPDSNTGKDIQSFLYNADAISIVIG